MQNHNFQTCAYHTGQGAIFQNFYSYKINAGLYVRCISYDINEI